MAFYTLWKWFSSWSKREYKNMIFWYNEYVLKTPDQRKREDIENKRKIKTILAQLGVINTICSNLGGDYYEWL